MSNLQERNYSIDGLRGGSALLIVCYHMFCRYQELYNNRTITFAFINYWGQLGVAIFFILSGLYMTRKHEKWTIIGFARKKFRRLWPAYFVAICVIFFFTHLFSLPGRECSLSEFFINIFFVNGFIGVDYVDSAHWYITSLIGIYFVIAVIYKFFYNRRFWVYNVWIVSSMVLHIVQQVSGQTIAAKAAYFVLQLLGGRYISLFVLVLLIQAVLIDREKMGVVHWGILVMSIGYQVILHTYVGLIEMVIAAVMVVLCLYNKIPFLRNPLLEYIGVNSYSIYVIHQNIGFLIERELQKQMGSFSYVIPLIAVICVLGLGLLLNTLVERSRQLLNRKI